ncbi:ComEC/Rec2 family competence protein [Streptomyces gobiensis]|uniref:ComEC/Rec2 family competence protein n=1 Tax=Streptomyces gobiensis TaxID=2875706 RepID=UPI001E54C2FE|nr:MBL fold metallo-hydrolase [Streptomyces gobiensis]UGY90773.1 MBL fold metallo-hydrolase [Streptomyces gobiensis]
MTERHSTGGDDSAPLDITILDVGHGNAAVVRDGTRCAVVDATPGDVVLTELERVGIERIEHLVISHADNDHAGGSLGLLLDDTRTLGVIWFNADGQKNSRTWERFRRAVWTRHRRGGCDGIRSIHTETGETLICGRARLEVCHPSILMAASGPTGHAPEFGTLTSNTLSVVVRVHLAEQPTALLAADMDAVAFRHIQETGRDLRAPVLVFPHHGGLPGKSVDAREFAQSLAAMVAPELVIFSIVGGLRPANPQPDIMSGVRHGAPEAHIACTQLSVHCHRPGEPVPEEHLALRPAAGRKNSRCCAGSVTVSRVGDELHIDPPLSRHTDFIGARVEQPLCRVTAVIPRQQSGDAARRERP